MDEFPLRVIQDCLLPQKLQTILPIVPSPYSFHAIQNCFFKCLMPRIIAMRQYNFWLDIIEYPFDKT